MYSISNKKVDNKYINFGKIIGGKYCVFKISHTVDAVQKAWMEIFSNLSKMDYKFDDASVTENITIANNSNNQDTSLNTNNKTIIIFSFLCLNQLLIPDTYRHTCQDQYF